MTKEKIEIIFFSKDALIQSEEEKKTVGQLFIEVSSRGKFLCYEKGDLLREIPLTKKMYKNFNRFTSGVCVERFVEAQEMEYDRFANDVDGWEQEDDITTEDEIYYVKGDKRLNIGKEQTRLPAIVLTPTKIKAPFIVQVFKFSPKLEIK